MCTRMALSNAGSVKMRCGVKSSHTMSTMRRPAAAHIDRKSTRLNSSHTEIYTLSLHDALPIYVHANGVVERRQRQDALRRQILPHHVDDATAGGGAHRSEEHTSELQPHRDLHSFPTRRSSDLCAREWRCRTQAASRCAAASNPPTPCRRCDGRRRRT